MFNVFILCSGKSSRFGSLRPKWLLTHPNGKPLFARAVEGLELPQRTTIHLVVLQQHLKQFKISNRDIHSALPDCKIIAFDQATDSQAASAAKAILQSGTMGEPVFFKDCDSYFQCKPRVGDNHVVTSTLRAGPAEDVTAKCYVQTDTLGKIHNIVEKRVISEEFAIGGYGFRNGGVFMAAYRAFPGTLSEKFISHVILCSIAGGEPFWSVCGGRYEDYGTPRALGQVLGNYATLFIDLDGTLVTSGGPFGATRWGSGERIEHAVSAMRRMYDSGRYHLVVTTSRPEAERKLTERELKEKCIPHHQLVMGLPVAPRVLVNDQSPLGPPSARAICVTRNGLQERAWEEFAI